MKKSLFYFGLLFLTLPRKCWQIIKSAYLYIYTGSYALSFASFGKNSVIVPSSRMIVGANYIEIGNNVILGKQIQLTAYDNYAGQSFSPSIIIGSGTNIGDYSHITAINSIIIGNNVLTGRNILITDNSHGDLSIKELLSVPVKERPMHSKGRIIIGDNTWIGEKASIIGSVIIGQGCIIGANAVVTKNVPDFTLVVGSPARYINLK